MSADAPETTLPNAVTATIAAVRSALNETFACLDALCALPVVCLHQRLLYPQALTAAEHLKHFTFVNNNVSCWTGS